MMGIYIKGMEMPEHCGYCRFRYDGICHALQKTQYSMDDCPLIPVPPHGDLIDRGKAVRDLRMDYAYAAANVVMLQPTIIPAEEGERRLQKPKEWKT